MSLASPFPPPHAAAGGRSPAFVTVATLALLWNGFGLSQLLHHLTDTEESLQRMGMTAVQAAAYANEPWWMTVGFAVGTVSGLAGSAALLALRASATPILTASLAGYVVLFIGDVTEGIFAALGASQVVILSAVVLIAAGMLAWSRHLQRRGLLR